MIVEYVFLGVIIIVSIVVGVLIILDAYQKRQFKECNRELSVEQLKKCGVSNRGVSMDDNEIYTVPYEHLGFY